MKQELINFVVRNLSPAPPPQQISIQKLFGQASTRQYFRVKINDRATLRQGDSASMHLCAPSSSHQVAPSYVIMQLPHGSSSPAEEITKTDANAPKEHAFISVQKYLWNLGIKVPQILGQDTGCGLLLMEDLGNTSLENLIQGATEKAFLSSCKKAVDTLIDLQIRTQAHPSQHCAAFFKKFDADLLDWEFNHFLEYGIEDCLKIRVEKKEKELYRSATQKISRLITEMPQGFVHRDFQSRNIHLKNEDFYLIDFQDALIGPVLYDLVALLRDSYVFISPQQLDALLDYYFEHLPATHPYFKKESFKSDFHLITLQRKLKDAGRFQYIKTVKNNPAFLKHVPQSLAYVKHALKSLVIGRWSLAEEMRQLHEWLAKYLQNAWSNE